VPYRIARRLLEAYGVTFCREVVVGTADAAVAAANGIGYPVVIKADVPGLVHKTEAAAVRLSLRDESAVRESVRDLQTRLGASTLVVQEQIGPGVELLVGGRRDASFGPLVALGTGGVLTEVIRDVSLRLAPVTDEEASEMLREGVRERLLAGPRGLLPVEPAPLLAVVRAVGDLLVAEPRIVEIDVNPVIAAGARAVAVDAVVIVGEPAAGGYDAA
jgi:hypothetical protein